MVGLLKAIKQNAKIDSFPYSNFLRGEQTRNLEAEATEKIHFSPVGFRGAFDT